MASFNKSLIKEVKLFKTEENEDYFDEKYSFIKYVVSNLESVSPDNIEICEEEFKELQSNIDAYYYEEDSFTHNIYLAIYKNNIDDHATLGENEIQKEYQKIINFIKNVINGDYANYDESSMTFSIADDIHSQLKESEIVANIITNYNLDEDLKKDNIEQYGDYRVSFRTYDFKDLENKFNQIEENVAKLDLTEKFGTSIPAIKIDGTNDFDVYLFSMRGIWLAKLYEEDSTRLLEANVRSYLKRTAKVNAGILETVKTAPKEFISYNNGISAVATGIIRKENKNNQIIQIEEIDNFQIVNGGQTTATLYECYKDKLIENLEDVEVQVKLTVVKSILNSDFFISNISTYSNTQTVIKKSDPPSNLPYYKQIKNLSKNCLSINGIDSYVCYFERTNGEYDTEMKRSSTIKKFKATNPKEMKFDKIDLARAINCWEQLPYIACYGKEKCFSTFNDSIKNQVIEPDETYFKNAYAIVLLYRKLLKIAKDLSLSVKSNVAAYTISYLSYISDRSLDLNEIWEKKDISNKLRNFIIELMPKIHNSIINAPNECPEPRMWARKQKCWDKILQITIENNNIRFNNKIEFFKKNDALIYISEIPNFYSTLTWMKLLLWDNKSKQLNANQIKIVKMMRSSADKKTGKLTKKQIDYLKDIFVYAVKKGYEYL